MKIKQMTVGKANQQDSLKARFCKPVLFKLIGGLQVGKGVICALLGVVDLVLFLSISSHYDDDVLETLTVASFPIWCGLWYIVTGILGVCIAIQKTNLQNTKMAYFILCILIFILFGPACCAVETNIVDLRYDDARSVHEWLIPLLIAIVVFIEIILAVVTVCICCCCAPRDFWETCSYDKQTDEFQSTRNNKSTGIITDHNSSGNVLSTARSRTPDSAISTSQVSVHTGSGEMFASSRKHVDENKQSVSMNKLGHEKSDGSVTPSNLWLPWSGGIPAVGRLAHVSVMWRNKVKKTNNSSEVY